MSWTSVVANTQSVLNSTASNNISIQSEINSFPASVVASTDGNWYPVNLTGQAQNSVATLNVGSSAALEAGDSFTITDVASLATLSRTIEVTFATDQVKGVTTDPAVVALNGSGAGVTFRYLGGGSWDYVWHNGEVDQFVRAVEASIGGNKPDPPSAEYRILTQYNNLTGIGSPADAGYVNITQHWGYNVDDHNPADVQAEWAIESKYWLNNVGPFVCEWHAQMLTLDNAGARPFTIVAPHSSEDKASCESAFAVQSFKVKNYGTVIQFNIDNNLSVATLRKTLDVSGNISSNNVTAPEVRTANATLNPGSHYVSGGAGLKVWTLHQFPVLGQTCRATSANGVSVRVYPHTDQQVVQGANSTTIGAYGTGYVALAANSTIELICVDNGMTESAVIEDTVDHASDAAFAAANAVDAIGRVNGTAAYYDSVLDVVVGVGGTVGDGQLVGSGSQIAALPTTRPDTSALQRFDKAYLTESDGTLVKGIVTWTGGTGASIGQWVQGYQDDSGTNITWIVAGGTPGVTHTWV